MCITEQVNSLRELSDRLLQADLFYVKTMLKQAADNLEVYHRAFEDMKEELYKERTNISFNLSEEKAKWTNSGIYDGLVWSEEIIDKYNPDNGRK